MASHGAVLASSAFAWWRRGRPCGDACRVHARLALYPAGGGLGFMAFSRITVGEWFVSGGFFVPDDALRGQPVVVFDKIARAMLLGGDRARALRTDQAIVVVLLSLVRRETGADAGAACALRRRRRCPSRRISPAIPFRIRYEIPLVVASRVVVGLAVGLLRDWAKPVALAACFSFVYRQRPPFDPRAPMVAEAQLDRVNVEGARARDRVPE